MVYSGVNERAEQHDEIGHTLILRRRAIRGRFLNRPDRLDMPEGASDLVVLRVSSSGNQEA